MCGDELTRSKPHPEIYETIIKHFHFSPQDAVILEDSVAGVQAAYSAKIPCIMVPDLISPTDLQEKQTIAIVKSLKDIMELLKKLK